MSVDFFMGVLASVAAMPVGWFLLRFYKKKIRPLADQALYKGSLVEGNWVTQLDFSGNDFNKIEIKINRFGYDVTGKARCVEGYASGEEFEIRGDFTPPLLTASYKSLAQQSTERGAIALLHQNNGSILRGQIIYSDDEEEAIFATECILKRAGREFNW
jgi:hypothetical protein